MFKFKKSQAALEFLTTYAWAFLVILIMIGALAYFGVLKPSKLFPDRCNFGAEISCNDYAISSSDTFNIRLKNVVGEPIVLQTITLKSESSTSYSCTLTSTTTLPYTWGTDTITDFSFDSCNTAASGFIKGDKAKVAIIMTYYLAKSSAIYTRQVEGEVFSTVT